MIETIFAKSSGIGKAGVSVFRVSGTKSLYILEQISDIRNNGKIEPQKTYLVKIFDLDKKFLVDQAICVYFKQPRSYTGEDMVEIYTHGSGAIHKILFKIFNKFQDVRLAQAGEFTKRAFLNNKIDLIKVGAISDLIESETEEQLKQATSKLSGNLSKLYLRWKDILTQIITKLEALIDFPEEIMSNDILENIFVDIKILIQEIKSNLKETYRGEIIKQGLKLAIIGPPNAGKSSLMNFLLSREISIISEISGTTRDIIEGFIDIKGYPITICDTAGIHSSYKDSVEKQGIERSLKLASKADIKILLVEYGDIESIENFDKIIKENHSILLLSKSDIKKNKDENFEKKINLYNKDHIKISVKNGYNMEILLTRIGNLAENLVNSKDYSSQTSNKGNKLEMEKALHSLIRISHKDELILIAEKVRIAKNALCKLTGEITTEEILGKIFANFCIGK